MVDSYGHTEGEGAVGWATTCSAMVPDPLKPKPLQTIILIIVTYHVFILYYHI